MAGAASVKCAERTESGSCAEAQRAGVELDPRAPAPPTHDDSSSNNGAGLVGGGGWVGMIVAASCGAIRLVLFSPRLREGRGLGTADTVDPGLVGVPATPTSTGNVTGYYSDEIAGMTPCGKHGKRLGKDITALPYGRLIVQPIFGAPKHFVQPSNFHTVGPRHVS